MTENPFEAPMSDLNPDQEPHDANYVGGIRVDGHYLIVRSNTVLPPFCIKTSEPISESEMVKKTLSWLPPMYGLVLLVGGPLVLLIVYLLARKQCVLTYGTATVVRKQRRRRILMNVVISILLFLAIPICAAIDWPPAIVMALVAFLASIVALLLMGSQLRITKHRDGEFWITGCSNEFLSRISTSNQDSVVGFDR